MLEAAYNDASGVTREFNRNILRVVNRGVDADFRPEAFRHVAFYNEAAARIEMHLVADSPQVVHLAAPGADHPNLAAGENIWTESSYKFTRAGAQAMLEEAGFGSTTWHTDSESYFALARSRADRLSTRGGVRGPTRGPRAIRAARRRARSTSTTTSTRRTRRPSRLRRHDARERAAARRSGA